MAPNPLDISFAPSFFSQKVMLRENQRRNLSKMKILKTLKHEFLQVLPPTIFFFVAFNVIALTKSLMLRQHGISFSGFAAATIGALIVGKVILISDKLPFINIFQDKPLIYNSFVNTFVYIFATLLFRFVEHFIPFLREYNQFNIALSHFLTEIVWARFWAIQIWLLVLFFIFSAVRELIRAIGKDQFILLFLGRS